MNSVATGAVRHPHLTGAQRQAVKTVLERGDVSDQAVLAAQASIAVTAATGFTGNVGGEDRRVRLASAENAVLAVAIGAHRDVAISARERDAVHALPVVGKHLGVALSTRRRDVGSRRPGVRVRRVQDLVRPVTVGAHRTALASRDQPRMHAGQIRLDRADDGNMELLRQLDVAVTAPAGGGQLRPVRDRVRVRVRFQHVDGAVAVGAGRRF